MANDFDNDKSKYGIFISGFLMGIIPALIVVIGPKFLPEKVPPRFSLKNPHIHPKDSLIVVAENESAMRKKPLNIEFEGLKFVEGGEPIPNSQPQAWFFSLKNPQIPSTFLLNGTHTIKIGFKGEPLFEELQAYFNTNLPYFDQSVSAVTDTSIYIGSASNLPVNHLVEKDTLIFESIQHSFDIGSRIAIFRGNFFEAYGKVNTPCQQGFYWFCFIGNNRIWPQDYLKSKKKSFDKQFAIPTQFTKGKMVLACLPQELHNKFKEWTFGQITQTNQPLIKPDAFESKVVMETIILVLD